MTEHHAGSRIRVDSLTPDGQQMAAHWAQRLALPLDDAEADFALQVAADGLQLQQLGDDAPGPVRVDFVEGKAAHRRLFGGGSGQMIAKAVIYLDPMFPHREKTALVKKEMRLFRPLVGDDMDAPALLEAALALASHRVVVKRPRKAPCIAGAKPSYALDGKSSRYDIYPKKALKGA
nr:hypothetical protein [Tanacetum cinerariifolium]